MAAKIAGFSARMAKLVLVNLAFAGAAGAAELHHIDCKVYAQQEQANVEAQKHADPSIIEERFDRVFYSEARNSCLASVYFVKGYTTYAGILDFGEGRIIWARSYRGRSFSPADIVAMDRKMDEQIKAMQQSSEIASARENDFLPILLDRTMNTLPAIRNAFNDIR
jgi:hypothetical protein